MSKYAVRLGLLGVTEGISVLAPVQARPFVDERMLEVVDRADDPRDPFELRALWLGRVEHELGRQALRPELAERWRSSCVHRRTKPDDVLTSRATVRFVKEAFNWFFFS